MGTFALNVLVAVLVVALVLIIAGVVFSAWAWVNCFFYKKLIKLGFVSKESVQHALKTLAQELHQAYQESIQLQQERVASHTDEIDYYAFARERKHEKKVKTLKRKFWRAAYIAHALKFIEKEPKSYKAFLT